MLELKEKPVCCGKEMFHEPNAQTLSTMNNEQQFWICWECGNFISLVEEQLDEEALENYKENYKQ